MTEKTEFLITAKDATAAAFNSVEKGLGKIGSALGSVQAAVLGAVGVGGMGALVKASMDTADALAKASDRLGIATESLAGLHYAGELAGISAESLNTGLGKMGKTLAEAAGGSKEADEAFRALHLSSKELSQMPADQAFMRISDALMNVDNNMQRLKLTQDIFGKGSTEIINLMAEGSEGMAAATAEAKAFGLALSRIDAAKIEIANDSFTRIKGVFSGIGTTIAVQLSPYIQGIGDWLVKSSVEADGFRSHVQIAMEAAAKSVAFLADMFRGLHVVWKGLEVAWYGFENTLAVGTDRIVHGVKSLANVLPGINIAPDENLQRWAFNANVELQKVKFNLEQLAQAEMPSAGIEEFFAKIKQLNAEVAATIAAKGAGMAGTGGIEPMPGIGDKEHEQTVKYEQELAKQLEALYLSTQPKLDVLGMEQAQKQALIDEGYLVGLTSEQLYYEQSALLEQQHQEKKSAAAAAARTKEYGSQSAWQGQVYALQQGSFNQQLQGAGIMLGQMSGLMLSHKKKEFETGKKAAIGEALVNTYLGVSAALAYGFPIGLIFAAISLAAGMMNVNRIRSQKFGGGGGATGTFSASPGTGLPATAGGGAGEPVAPTLPGTGTAAAPQPRVVNITFSGSARYTAEEVRDLISQINEQGSYGSKVNTVMA